MTANTMNQTEACHYLGIHPAQMLRYVEDGTIKRVQFKRLKNRVAYWRDDVIALHAELKGQVSK